MGALKVSSVPSSSDLPSSRTRSSGSVEFSGPLSFLATLFYYWSLLRANYRERTPHSQVLLLHHQGLPGQFFRLFARGANSRKCPVCFSLQGGFPTCLSLSFPLTFVFAGLDSVFHLPVRTLLVSSFMDGSSDPSK